MIHMSAADYLRYLDQQFTRIVLVRVRTLFVRDGALFAREEVHIFEVR